MKLQQAYDAVNQCGISLRKSAGALKGNIDNQIVMQGLEKARDAAACAEQLETLLFADKSSLRGADVKSSMVTVAHKYQVFRMKDLELAALVRSFCKKTE